MSTTKRLISNSLTIIIGTMLASVFSLIFSSIVMPRMLSPEQLGEFSSLMNLLTIISVAGGAILTVAMRYSSELYAEEKRGAIYKILAVMNKYVYYLACAIFVVSLFFLKAIANYLSIESIIPIAVAFSSILFGLVIMINRGILQGTQRFLALSAINIVEMSSRLFIGAALVKIGFGVSGALAGVVLATALSYLISFPAIRRAIASIKIDKTPKDYSFDKREIANYSWPAFVSSFLLVFALAIDVILIKHYFSAEDAGMYAAISNIGKIITYATAPIIAVMFPMISEKQTKGDKHYKIFLFSLLFVTLISLLILGLYSVVPGRIISLISGVKFIKFAYLLPQVGLAMVLYSMINLIANYYLVVRRFFFLWFFAIAEACQLVAIALWHDSVSGVIHIIILTLALLFALMMGYYLVDKRKQILSFFNGRSTDDD